MVAVCGGDLLGIHQKVGYYVNYFLMIEKLLDNDIPIAHLSHLWYRVETYVVCTIYGHYVRYE